MLANSDLTLSHYRLIQKIGQGGMGIVFRAQDETLRRPVAIKFLTAGSVDKEQGRARFLREARLAAALNHPSVCSIYEVAEVKPGDPKELPTGESIPAGTPFLVLELIEGRTLSELLGRCGALPLQEALRIAVPVVEGLAAAHERGIVHRDMKPGNVMLTTDERVKILDFGLAKHLWPAAPDDTVLSEAETISQEVTRAGMVVGTVAYMSPEQARGEPLDSRSDVFSFGIMLYEMVAGHRPFRGETSETTRLKIIEADPEPLPETVLHAPPELERIIWRCLRKKPDQRYNDTRDLVVALNDLLEEATSGGVGRIASRTDESAVSAMPRSPNRWSWILPWSLVAIFAPLVLIGWFLRPTDETVSPLVTRLTVPMPPGERLTSYYRPGLAMSPDGRTLAFVSGDFSVIGLHPFRESHDSRIYVRQLSDSDARPLPGTANAVWPVFSPDGEWIAFTTSQRGLKKVRVSGGDPLTLCDCWGNYGLDWGPAGNIAFGEMLGAIKQVSSSGGEPEPITNLDEEAHEVSHRLPHFLPGGKAILYTALSYKHVGLDWRRVKIFVASLDTGEQKLLIEGGSDARYAPTGHLLFAREGRLMAVPFDLEQLEVTGSPFPIVEGVSHSIHTGFNLSETGAAFVSLSASGNLAYVPGSIAPEPSLDVVWIDRQGREEPLGVEAQSYLTVRISPDGRQVLLSTSYWPQVIWLFDNERKTLRRQTFEGLSNYVVWGPGHHNLTFDSDREEPDRLYWKPIDAGPGGVKRLSTKMRGIRRPSSWSPDGKLLAFLERNPETDWDIFVVPLEGKAEPFLNTRFRETFAEFSPNGNWMLYTSVESGRPEVCVRRYPEGGSAIQVSTKGGNQPAWSRDGSEIFYVWEKKLFSVSIAYGNGQLKPGSPEELFEWNYIEASPIRSWDVGPDGRFLALREPSAADYELVRDLFAPDRIHVVVNWLEELKQKAEVAQ